MGRSLEKNRRKSPPKRRPAARSSRHGAGRSPALSSCPPLCVVPVPRFIQSLKRKFGLVPARDDRDKRAGITTHGQRNWALNSEAERFWAAVSYKLPRPF